MGYLSIMNIPKTAMGACSFCLLGALTHKDSLIRLWRFCISSARTIVFYRSIFFMHSSEPLYLYTFYHCVNQLDDSIIDILPEYPVFIRAKGG